MVLKDKVILITGGTGSFGQKFIEIALRECEPRVIRVYSRGELVLGNHQGILLNISLAQSLDLIRINDLIHPQYFLVTSSQNKDGLSKLAVLV